jgi:uncharacterized protein (TIGR03437 family)
MRQIVAKLKQQLLHSVTFRVFLVIGVLALAVAWPGLRSAARQGGFQRGDVFASLGNGQVLRFSQTTGTLLQTLDTATGTFVTGSAFDKDANLYVTGFGSRTIVKFDANGNRIGNFVSNINGRPESILFDPDGNAFVGTVDASNDVNKFDRNGAALDSFDVPTERRGSDWIDLAADRCTLYYTSEGARIFRYDICTKTALPDFVSNLPHSAAYALRLLRSGGLIVADTNEILRLDGSGNITQRYDAPGEDSWFAINLDPDGASFWSAGISTGNIYKFDIASGNQLTRIATGAGAIYGLSILGEITVVLPPSPTPTVGVTPTATPEGSADLVLTKTASPGLVTNGTLLTYNARITNNGPTAAVNVTFSDTLPPNTTFVACNASNGGTCTGSGRNRGAVFSRIGVGETVTVAIVVRVECAGITSTVLGNTAQVAAANFDPNQSNNVAQALVNVAPPQPKITIERNANPLDFGVVPLRPGGNPNPPSYLITVENVGCLPLTLGFGVARTGPDVASGRISDPDDRATFPIAHINGQQTFLTGEENVTVQGGTAANFRIFFDPKIPAVAGKTSGLSASQVIPDLINSVLTIFTNAPNGEGQNQNFSYPLVGRTGTESAKVQFINPTAPSLAPLVVIARNGDIFSVEFSVHDPNMDFFCTVYQFLDAANRPVGEAPVFYFGDDIAKANMVRGQSFTVVKQFRGANGRPNVTKVKVTVFDNLNNSVEISSNIGSQQGRIVNASAASFATESLAPEAIAAAFGSRLATTTRVAATAPLPIELAGTRVSVTDSRGVERPAQLFFVAPGQINYLIPRGTNPGPAVVTVAAADGAISAGNINITPVAPALFTAAATGQGVATGVVLRVRANGQQSYEPIARYDANAQRFVPVAIDVSNSSDQVYLVLFGSGIRYHRSPQPVGVTLGGVGVPVTYAGPQGGFAGVDQLNLLVPSRLAGRGEVEIRLNVDGRVANPVRVQIR